MGKRKEEYLEVIHALSKEQRIVRITDIAKKMKVRKSTVLSMLERLSSDGYVVHEKYGDVIMTELGIQKAEKLQKKHSTLFDFLFNVLELPANIAEQDACKLEHHISDEAIEKLSEYLKKK